jgi:hypothetical protein
VANSWWRARRAVGTLQVTWTDPTPKAYGIDVAAYRRLLPEMARQALASGTPLNNPRIPSEAEIIALYETAWDGGRGPVGSGCVPGTRQHGALGGLP